MANADCHVVTTRFEQDIFLVSEHVSLENPPEGMLAACIHESWLLSEVRRWNAGLTTTVAPIIRVLDKMYAGQMVMKQYCDAYGLDWSKWHPEVFESVQRRHESLVAEVRQVLTLDVPEGAFFPLGIKSQILLTGEGVAVDAEAQALVQEAAIAKAEAKFAEKQRLKEMELAGEGMFPFD